MVNNYHGNATRSSTDVESKFLDVEAQLDGIKKFGLKSDNILLFDNKTRAVTSYKVGSFHLLNRLIVWFKTSGKKSHHTTVDVSTLHKQWESLKEAFARDEVVVKAGNPDLEYDFNEMISFSEKLERLSAKLDGLAKNVIGFGTIRLEAKQMKKDVEGVNAAIELSTKWKAYINEPRGVATEGQKSFVEQGMKYLRDLSALQRGTGELVRARLTKVNTRVYFASVSRIIENHLVNVRKVFSSDHLRDLGSVCESMILLKEVRSLLENNKRDLSKAEMEGVESLLTQLNDADREMSHLKQTTEEKATGKVREMGQNRRDLEEIISNIETLNKDCEAKLNDYSVQEGNIDANFNAFLNLNFPEQVGAARLLRRSPVKRHQKLVLGIKGKALDERLSFLSNNQNEIATTINELELAIKSSDEKQQRSMLDNVLEAYRNLQNIPGLKEKSKLLEEEYKAAAHKVGGLESEKELLEKKYKNDKEVLKILLRIRVELDHNEGAEGTASDEKDEAHIARLAELRDRLLETANGQRVPIDDLTRCMSPLIRLGIVGADDIAAARSEAEVAKNEVDLMEKEIKILQDQVTSLRNRAKMSERSIQVDCEFAVAAFKEQSPESLTDLQVKFLDMMKAEPSSDDIVDFVEDNKDSIHSLHEGASTRLKKAKKKAKKEQLAILFINYGNLLRVKKTKEKSLHLDDEADKKSRQLESLLVKKNRLEAKFAKS